MFNDYSVLIFCPLSYWNVSFSLINMQAFSPFNCEIYINKTPQDIYVQLNKQFQDCYKILNILQKSIRENLKKNTYTMCIHIILMYITITLLYT